eukprot:Rmarinus@m.11954
MGKKRKRDLLEGSRRRAVLQFDVSEVRKQNELEDQKIEERQHSLVDNYSDEEREEKVRKIDSELSSFLTEISTVTDDARGPTNRVWVPVVDENTKATYYWNTQTHEVSWTLPEGAAEKEKPASPAKPVQAAKAKASDSSGKVTAAAGVGGLVLYGEESDSEGEGSDTKPAEEGRLAFSVAKRQVPATTPSVVAAAVKGDNIFGYEESSDESSDGSDGGDKKSNGKDAGPEEEKEQGYDPARDAESDSESVHVADENKKSRTAEG